MSTGNPSATTSAKIDEQFVRDHLPMVHCMVNDLVRRVPNHIRRDDLLSAGMLGLAQAINSFDPTREAKFSTFARTRIRGALLDELRSRDWASRGVRTRGREVDAAADELSSKLGRRPTVQELSSCMGSTPDTVNRIRSDISRANVLSIDATSPDADRAPIDLFAVHDDHRDPAEILAARELRAYLRDAIETLPPRLRTVVIGYFIEERPMADIADELDVTESRISHMRSEAMALVGEAIRRARDEFDSDAPTGEKAGVVVRRRAAYCAAVATASDFRSRLATTDRVRLAVVTNNSRTA